MLSSRDAAPDVLNLLIVEDHPVYLEGLCLVLNELANEVNITTVSGVQEAKLELSRHAIRYSELAKESSDNSYDLILLDLSLRDGSGIALLQHIQKHRIMVPVAILSASDNNSDIENALDCGACGFINKANGREEIIQAVKNILSGETYVPDFYRPIEAQYNSRPKLTPRQYEVLQLLAEGYPNKRICQQLNLTEHTVKSHIKTLYQLFKVHNRTASAAKEFGFID